MTSLPRRWVRARFGRTSGLAVETTHATLAGDINIQALNNVTIWGNRILNKTQIQYGAVAIKSRNTNGQGGDGDIRAVALTGAISAQDRAFDFDNRFDALNAITLSAAGSINLTVSALLNNGAADNTKAVVSSQGGGGGQGGTNTLRSYGGGINIGPNAQVMANAIGGTNGTNLLTSCAGVSNLGSVIPADLLPGDDAGVCGTPAPAALFTNCAAFGVVFEHDAG